MNEYILIDHLAFSTAMVGEVGVRETSCDAFERLFFPLVLFSFFHNAFGPSLMTILASLDFQRLR